MREELPLSSLPSVDRLVSDKRLKKLAETYPHQLLVKLVRDYLEEVRASMKVGASLPAIDIMVEVILSRAAARLTPSLKRIINATGVILHTNLGRAPLSRETAEAMEAASKGYINLEMDVESGTRGSRQVHVQTLLQELTGAEAALVVNNNAGAVLLALAALCKGKEVIVSRGQAVEIGGGFRIPEVMRQSGARLVEVGTTNMTYIADYEAAISERTAALLRVHSSNFRIVGFTQSVTMEEFVELGRKHSLLVLDDVGSGCFFDTTHFGLDAEPMVQKSVAAGASLTLFSGDKLMGGPQAGIIVGKKPLIDKLGKHPLARALRIDKTRLAGLTVTLLHYLKGEAAIKLPIWQMISADIDGLRQRAERWAGAAGNSASVVKGESEVGGGSLPGSILPTWLLYIKPEPPLQGKKLRSIAAALKNRETPILGRIAKDAFILDPRTVLTDEDAIVLGALKSLV